MARDFLSAQRRPLLFAHRGLRSDGRAENTIDAYEAAYAAGADAIECDLRLADDGELFLFHDREVAVSGGLQPTRTLNRRARGDRSFPSLGELLNLQARWPTRGVVFDAKTREAADVLLSRVRPEPHLMIISFSDAVVIRACERGWNAGLIEGFLPMVLRDLAPPDAYICPSLGRLRSYADELTPSELALSNVGTVDDVSVASALAARGVWAITTNTVDVLALALRSEP